MGLFNRVNLETPESVELEFNLAGIGNRVYALSLDYLLLWSSLVVILMVWGFLSFYIVNSIVELGNWAFAIQLLIMFFIYTGYFVFFETLWQGQTPGKRWVKIRVISDDGTNVSLTQCLLRSLLRPIDDFFFLGAFLIIFSKYEKRIGDLVAGTIIVKEEETNRSRSNKLAIAPEAHNLAQLIQAKADLTGLLPEEFATIREYLERREHLTPEARNKLSEKLANRVIKLLGLEEVLPGRTPELLLEAVYLAYQDQFYRPN